MWSLEFSESVDRRDIHQLAATYKTNKKMTVVFRRPSNGKVSLFSEDLELRAAVVSIQNLIPCLVCLISLLWREKRRFVFLG